MSLAVGFVGGRLSEARKARAVTASDLAAMVGVSVASVSKYENERQVPRQETVTVISNKLSLPREYFFRPIIDDDVRPVFWRSQLSAPAYALDRANVRLNWFKELVDFLAEHFDYPSLDLPDVRLPKDIKEIGADDIETLASEVRGYWGVRPGPLPNIIERLERSGVLVSRIHVNVDKVDAFSQWSEKFGIPMIMLSRDKASAVRQRFDALHELFHILAHRHVTPDRLVNRQMYKLMEDQANAFASFMLLPEREFMDELYAPTLDGMLSLKENWGVSVAAMIVRCKSLDLLDDDSSKRMWMNYTRRGWRKGEPFDSTMKAETPHLIRRSVEMLIEKEVLCAADFTKALPFPVGELEELADLEPGQLGGRREAPEPVLKAHMQRSGNVVSLFGGDKN